MFVQVVGTMKLVVLLLFLIAKCWCELDFEPRSRDFSIELIDLMQKQRQGHVVTSPFGIWSLVNSMAVGSAGRSYEQLAQAFLLPTDSKNLISSYKSVTKSILEPTSKDVSLSSANYMFLANDFYIKTEFQKSVVSDFGIFLKTLDFNNPESAARSANNFIQNADGIVSNVLSPEDFQGSRMLLTNVVSFKGLWALPFNKSLTRVQPFFDENRKVCGNVNMMYQKAEFSISNIKYLKSFVLEMPYGTQDKFSMLFILPHPNAKVSQVYERLASISVEDILKKLNDDTEALGLEEVDVKIPRFKISTNIVLNQPFNDMGVYDIFEPEIANFERVTNETIYVSAIVHKADIEVTESGSVATASSSASFADRKITKFVAERPFIYLVIKKSSSTVIFGGVYSKPSLF